MDWYVYILECETGKYYTGITTDVERRFNQHKRKRGARFTLKNGAKKIVYIEKCVNISDARKREIEIKTWSREEKEALMGNAQNSSGNKGKLEEVRQILGDIEELDIDLPEIQEIDPHRIIEEKLKEAQKAHKGEFIVEDTSLYLEALNGLPGPLIKWFLKTIGNEGLYDISIKFKNKKVVAKTLIGYADKKGSIKYFEGAVEGTISIPKGEGFGWDPIFLPDGYLKTFGEMSAAEKNSISMRKIALVKMRDYLNGK
jgi:inosine triphosphate pyrophosphatase